MFTIIKRLTLISLTALFVILLCSVTSLGSSLEELKISYSPMPLNVPSIISKRMDMFDKAFKAEDIDIKYIPFTAGPQMTEAIASKSLDVASVMGAASAIVAKAAGVDIKIIGAYSMAPTGFALVVPLDSKVTSVRDLKGKKVGGPKGTAAHQLLGKILKTNGMGIKDVDFLNMQVPDAAAALVSKDLDAAILVEPVLTKLVDSKKVRILKDGTNMIGGLTVIVARGDLVRQNPALLKKFLKVHRQSVDYIREHMNQTVDDVAEETNLTKDQVKKLIPKYDFDPKIRPEVTEELKDCVDFMYDLGMIKKRVDINDLVADNLQL